MSLVVSPGKDVALDNFISELGIFGSVVGATMEGTVRLPLPTEQLNTLVNDAKDFVMSHGLLVRTREDPECPDVASRLPFMFLPSPFPRHCFEAAIAVQKDFNELMHKVAHDYDFLKEALQSTIKVNDFTRRLWNVYEQVRGEGMTQPCSLALTRSDYMVDGGAPTNSLTQDNGVYMAAAKIKQIEYNTIAVGLGGLCTRVVSYYRFILGRLGCEDKIDHLPANNAAIGLAEGFTTAWDVYGNDKAVILFIVQEKERNLYDQRWLEYAIYDINPRLTVIRKTIRELGQTASLTEDKRLFVDGKEVAIVYLRTLYDPRDLPSEQDWSMRLQLERSRAIKCPSVNYQLAGTKKVQQVLAKPGCVQRYIKDPAAVSRITATFAGQYSLDMDKEGDKTVAMAMENPDKFVLKPQREGGGNNIFGDEICTVLSKISTSEERSGYIIMERIHPIPLRNYSVSPGKDVALDNFVSELGIFGSVVGTADEIVLNKQKGYILRTKAAGTDEGGFIAGNCALDTPLLL